MKLVIALFALALLSNSAFARPGETITQWKKRFENATQTPVDELGVYVQLEGGKSRIHVQALSQKNAVIYECYTKFVLSDDLRYIPSDEIDAILKSLSDGKAWKVVVEQKDPRSRCVWSFGDWTAEYDWYYRERKLRVYTAQWPACKLRNTTRDWQHELPIDRKEVKAPAPKLGL